MPAQKKTTIILDEDDQDDLTSLATLQKASEVEAIRKSIRLANMLMQWQGEGGSIVLQKGKDRRELQFVW